MHGCCPHSAPQATVASLACCNQSLTASHNLVLLISHTSHQVCKRQGVLLKGLPCASLHSTFNITSLSTYLKSRMFIARRRFLSRVVNIAVNEFRAWGSQGLPRTEPQTNPPSSNSSRVSSKSSWYSSEYSFSASSLYSWTSMAKLCWKSLWAS